MPLDFYHVSFINLYIYFSSYMLREQLKLSFKFDYVISLIGILVSRCG
jgi:hypothetical protein